MAAWWEWTCANCGNQNSIPSSEKWTLAWRILEKAKSEYLTNQDYSTSIVFSVTKVTDVIYVHWFPDDTADKMDLASRSLLARRRVRLVSVQRPFDTATLGERCFPLQ